MYRFLWQPRWIISHVLIAALVVTMINLGFWQLRRLDERRDLNARIFGRSEQPEEKFDDVVRGIETVEEGRGIDYRHVWVRGTYQPEREVIVPGRSSGGAPGRWIATPLVTDEGRTVLVLRGHLAAVADDDVPPIDQAEPPAGEVELLGYVRRSQERQGLEPKDAALEPHQYARLDLPRIAEREGLEELEPVLVQLAVQEPPTDTSLLRPVALPELTEGSHFSYAIQWWIFSTIAVVGYPLVLRRTARNRAAAEASRPGGSGGPPEPDEPSEPDGSAEPARAS